MNRPASWLIPLLLMLAGAWCHAGDTALNRQLARVTGEAGRVVWLRDFSEEARDVFANGDQLALMALGAGEENGARTLRGKGALRRPLISPDGTQVVYSVMTGRAPDWRPQIRSIPWAGGPERPLADGYAIEVWRDPGGRVWVYALQNLAAVDSNVTGNTLVRFPLDKPQAAEVLIAGQLLSADNFQLSRSGRLASALLPWPKAGLLEMPPAAESLFQPLPAGCWTALAPDDSGLAWVFDGPHRRLRMYLPGRKLGWTVNISERKEMKNKSAYHPRWSNHPHFITWTGPYNSHVSRGGGRGARVFVAKLNEAAGGISTEVKLTDREPYPDLYPDLWISGGESISFDPQHLGLAKGVKPFKLPEKIRPGGAAASAGALFAWSRAGAAGGNDADAPTPSGYAWLARQGAMCVQGGSFRAPTAASARAVAALTSGESWALSFAAEPLRAGGCLLSCGGFAILQEAAGHLIIHTGLRSWQTAESLPEGKLTAVFLNAMEDPANPRCTFGGREIALQPGPALRQPPGGEPLLRFGAEPDGSLPWHGLLEGITLHGPGDTFKNSQKAADALTAEISARPAPEKVRVRVRITLMSDPLEPADLGSYARSWTGGTAEVLKVISGDLAAQKIGIAWWTIMDRRKVSGRLPAAGTELEVDLEPMLAHPLLESERGADDTDALEIPWFISLSPLPG